MRCLGQQYGGLAILKTINSHISHTKFQLTNIATATNVHLKYLPSIIDSEKKLEKVGPRCDLSQCTGWQTLSLYPLHYLDSSNFIHSLVVRKYCVSHLKTESEIKNLRCLNFHI